MRLIATVARELLTSGRWRRSLALALLFAVACAGLSWWQFSRRAETAAQNRRITANYSAPAVPLDRLLSSDGGFSPATEWRPVSVTGVYLESEQLLARNRPLNGSPGFEVLTPLRTTAGRVFVVDRGWLAIGQRQDRPDHVPVPPSGTVTVVARLRPTEPTLIGRSAPTGEIPSIDVPEIHRTLGMPTYTGVYGIVDSESPAVADMPAALPRPSFDEGTHLSYAIQWILFAAGGFGALAWAVRRDLRDAGDPLVLESDERARLRRRGRAPTDEAHEDALLP